MNEQQPGVFGWIQQHPMMVVIGIAVVVFGAFFLKKQSPPTTDTSAATGTMDTSGLDKDANGNPILYRDVSDTFINKVTNIGSDNTTTTTTNNPVVPPVEHPIEPTTVAPANKGTLGTTGAGKGDTNFWVYTVPAGSTLTSLAEFAKWGTDFHKLANYRNNATILKAAGVDINNPYAAVPAGLQISV